MGDDVTFCIHVKNRREQLARTLPENLDATRAYPGVGLVLLDYNSEDGLGDWFRTSFATEMRDGRILYARERTAKHFHASKAKNLAHRVASGRLLVNLDCDNFIGGTIPFLLEMSRSSDKAVVHVWSGEYGDGTFGRIAVSTPLFLALGGYDESLLPIGFEDRDLLKRARRFGADMVSIAGSGFAEGGAFHTRAIPNSRSESMRYTGSRLGYTTMNRLNRVRSLIRRAVRGPVANRDGWGRASLEINFERELDLL